MRESARLDSVVTLRCVKGSNIEKREIKEEVKDRFFLLKHEARRVSRLFFSFSAKIETNNAILFIDRKTVTLFLCLLLFLHELFRVA